MIFMVKNCSLSFWFIRGSFCAIGHYHSCAGTYPMAPSLKAKNSSVRALEVVGRYLCDKEDKSSAEGMISPVTATDSRQVIAKRSKKPTEIFIFAAKRSCMVCIRSWLDRRSCWEGWDMKEKKLCQDERVVKFFVVSEAEKWLPSVMIQHHLRERNSCQTAQLALHTSRQILNSDNSDRRPNDSEHHSEARPVDCYHSQWLQNSHHLRRFLPEYITYRYVPGHFLVNRSRITEFLFVRVMNWLWMLHLLPVRQSTQVGLPVVCCIVSLSDLRPGT